MKFLKTLLASLLGFFIALFLIFVFFTIIVSAMMSSQDEVVVNSNSILELDLSAQIRDYAPKDQNPWVSAFDLDAEKLGLNSLIAAVENAKNDKNIKGISIKTPFVNTGIAQTQSLRDKLEEFKESGKFIYAYNDFYQQKNYYLSSVADSIFINPAGFIDFRGLSTEILYYKDFEDKYGVKMEVVRHGKYKSAAEPFISNKMSLANREQIMSFLSSIWSEIIEDINISRKITVQQLNYIADNLNGRNATLALKNNLVDGVMYENDYKDKLKELIDTKPNFISIKDYIKSGKGRIKSASKNKIAVIYAQGEILYGEGDEQIIGQGIINNAIIKAKEDKNVKAIVLRVNSPGGSALAAELIWKELELAKEEKPLVVSMGNYAASGGYYIACNADKIIAEPTTITGSIGVFAMLPNAHDLVDRIGINAEQVSTNSSPSYSVFEPMDNDFYRVTEEGVAKVYNTFIERVSNGRAMKRAQVDALAQGRVWTGKEALKKGLVDKLGSLDDAVALAAELAQIDSYRVRNYPSYKKDFKEKLKYLPLSLKTKITKEFLGDDPHKIYSAAKQLKDLKGIQVRMPYILEIK
ncbi:MAG: signal peptide peptidase SppA [Tenacibaculum sp.]